MQRKHLKLSHIRCFVLSENAESLAPAMGTLTAPALHLESLELPWDAPRSHKLYITLSHLLLDNAPCISRDPDVGVSLSGSCLTSPRALLRSHMPFHPLPVFTNESLFPYYQGGCGVRWAVSLLTFSCHPLRQTRARKQIMGIYDTPYISYLLPPFNSLAAPPVRPHRLCRIAPICLVVPCQRVWCGHLNMEGSS